MLKSGKKVWWNAGREGAAYYQVALSDGPGKSGAVWLMNPSADTLAALPAPDMIIISKPDVFDGGGACADFLVKGRYVKRENLAGVYDLAAMRRMWSAELKINLPGCKYATILSALHI